MSTSQRKWFQHRRESFSCWRGIQTCLSLGKPWVISSSMVSIIVIPVTISLPQLMNAPVISTLSQGANFMWQNFEDCGMAEYSEGDKPSLSILLNTPSKVSRRPSFCFALDNCMKAAICMQAICHQLLELHGLISVFSGNKSW